MAAPTLEEMGDCKPSQFLRSLAQDVPDDFLRSNWSGQLPPIVWKILTGQCEGDLDAVACCANCITEDGP
jgi:hypothetical protein